MASRLVLERKNPEDTYGTVKPLQVVNGSVIGGLSVGTWRLGEDGIICIDLNADLDTIIHEVATRKAVRAELRAAEKDAKGTEIKPIVEYDPVARRFRQIYPE